MNIDSINHKDPELGEAISASLKILQQGMRDPFFQVILNFFKISGRFIKNLKFYKKISKKYKFSTRKLLKKLLDSLSLIRKTGEERILDRIATLKDHNNASTDILTSILKGWSRIFKYILNFSL